MTVMNPLTSGPAPVTVGMYRGVFALALLSACVDGAGVRQQVDLITTNGTVENGAAYSIRAVSSTAGVNFDTTWSFTTAATGGEALLDGLIAAILADPYYGRVFALVEKVSATQMRITWAGGRAGTISFPANPTTDLSNASTAAGFTQYAWGDLVAVGQSSGNLSARHPLGTGGGEFAVTLATNNNSQGISFDLLVTDPLGAQTHVPFAATSAASAALTIAALVTALETALPLAAVEITTVNEEITVTMPPGYSIVRSSPIVDGTVVLTTDSEPPAALPEIGIVTHDRAHTAPVESVSGPAEATGPCAGMPFTVLRHSGGGGIEYIVPLSSGSPAMGGPVYVDTDGGAHAAAAAGRTLAPRLRWGSLITTTHASIAL